MTSCWQYEWKRPEWEEILNDDDDFYRDKECVDMSCAELFEAEDNKNRIVTTTLYEDENLQYIVISTSGKEEGEGRRQRNEACWKWPKSLNNDPLSFVQFCYTSSSISDCDEQEEARRKKHPKTVDLDIHQAVDLVNLLSFQQTHDHKYAHIRPTQPTQHPPQEEEEEEEDKVLTVCCTTRHGSVYFYPLSSLLNSSDNKANTSSRIQDTHKETKDAWILGNALQSILSQQYLHWSPCMGKTQLSLTQDQHHYDPHMHTLLIQKAIATPNYLVLISSINNKQQQQQEEDPPFQNQHNWWNHLFQKQNKHKEENTKNDPNTHSHFSTKLNSSSNNNIQEQNHNHQQQQQQCSNKDNDWWLETKSSSSSSSSHDNEQNENGDENDTDSFNEQDETRRKKENTNDYSNFCFVHFISLEYLSETACVTLPLTEANIVQPILYHEKNLQFLIVMGKNSLKEAYAIRMDTLSTLGLSSLDDDDENTIMVSKFIPIPVQFPSISIENNELPLSVGTIFTNPPSILTTSTVHNEHEDPTNVIGMYTLSDLEIDRDDYLIWSVQHSPQHYAQIPSSSSSLSNNIQWCLAQQGCSFVGYSHAIYFISWEGATISHGATVQLIHNYLPNTDDENDTELRFCHTIIPHLLTRPLAPNNLIGNDNTTKTGNILTNQDASFWKIPELPTNGTKINSPPHKKLTFSSQIINLPKINKPEEEDSFYFGLGSRQRSTGLLNEHDDNSIITTHHPSEYDDIIIDALDSVKNIPSVTTVQENKSTSQSSNSNLFNGLNSNSEIISHQLLHKCASWTQLDDTKENRDCIDGGQNIVGIIRSSTQKNKGFVSLRKNVVENGIATPFSQVLTWLCLQKKDYTTAASIACNLLHDFEAIRGLRSSSHKSFATSEESHHFNLEGLLDGIVPLDKNDFLKAEKSVEDSSSILPNTRTMNPPNDIHSFSLDKSYKKDENIKVHNVITSLADMAVGCMVRGGVDMSHTLEGFLSRNIFYDASRACLMLAASTMDEIEKEDSCNRLWPIQCLLRIASVRDCMSTALLLLNIVIPNVLRARPTAIDMDNYTVVEEKGSETQKKKMIEELKQKQLDLCKSVIIMIVSSSQDAARILLDTIIEEDTHKSYWQSLTHATRLELSLIQINNKCPFLLEPEVRTWALNEINTSIHDDTKALPVEWLRKICSSCLLNAGCNLTLLLKQSSNMEEDIIVDDADDVEHYTRDKKNLALSLKSIFHGDCCRMIDFNMIIASLLILQKQGQSWHQHASVSTQSLLCFLCDLAGRKSNKKDKFDDDNDDVIAVVPFDGVLAMLQCGKIENIIAGASLIGGHDGFVLKCIDIVMNYYDQISMKDAEDFLLYGGDPLNSMKCREEIGDELLTEGNRRLLWLLESHLLSIDKYGDLIDDKRGKINPDFATRTCLRAWLALNNGKNNSILSSWLSVKLKLSDSIPKKNRLACAVLARVLLWPDCKDVDSYESKEQAQRSSSKILAESLQLDPNFLIALSKSCCGMVESVPPTVANNIFRSST